MEMKNTITINHELGISYPDGFHVMDPGERQRLRVLEDGPVKCLSDPERHIMISIGYKQPPKLALMMLNAKDIAKNAEKKIRKAMQPFGYRPAGFTDRSMGGEKAYGFAYEYEAQGTGMYAETFALKKGKTVYYLHFYARKALQEESAALWKEICDSMYFF